MSDRHLIGRHPTLGASGIFLSQPGDSVMMPTKAMLADSRYQNISVHQQGRIRLSREVFSTTTVWYGTATWPSLGYTPLYYGSLTYVTPNALGIPVNTDYYPTTNCSRPDIAIAAQTDFGIWLEGDSVLRAKVYIQFSIDAAFDLNYIVFKRAL